MREPVGLILSGGRGTRMGGAVKAEVQLGGTRLLDHCIERIEPQVKALAISTNTPLDTNLPQLGDASDASLGPLAGVLAGLDWALDQDADHLVSVAVDTPFLPCDLVPQLLMAGDGGLAVAQTSDGMQGTFALWPVVLRDDLAAFLGEGERKVRRFMTRHSAAIAPFPDTTPPAFFNINTPDDLLQAQTWV